MLSFLIVLVIIPRMGSSPFPLVFSIVLWICILKLPVPFLHKRSKGRFILVPIPLPYIIFLRALWMLLYILLRSFTCTDPAFTHHSEFTVFHLIEVIYGLEPSAIATLLMLHSVYNFGFASHTYPWEFLFYKMIKMFLTVA